MHDPETIQEIASASDFASSPVDSDPRIREYDPDDRSQVEDWMEGRGKMPEDEREIGNAVSVWR